jgi:DNA-binding protein HU-beta
MNKAELVAVIVDETGISKGKANLALDAFTKAVSNSLKKGDRVAIPGFGTFNVSQRAARTGRNPQTGQPIKIAAKKVVRFKPSSNLNAEM